AGKLVPSSISMGTLITGANISVSAGTDLHIGAVTNNTTTTASDGALINLSAGATMFLNGDINAFNTTSSLAFGPSIVLSASTFTLSALRNITANGTFSGGQIDIEGTGKLTSVNVGTAGIVFQLTAVPSSAGSNPCGNVIINT